MRLAARLCTAAASAASSACLSSDKAREPVARSGANGTASAGSSSTNAGSPLDADAAIGSSLGAPCGGAGCGRIACSRDVTTVASTAGSTSTSGGSSDPAAAGRAIRSGEGRSPAITGGAGGMGAEMGRAATRDEVTNAPRGEAIAGLAALGSWLDAGLGAGAPGRAGARSGFPASASIPRSGWAAGTSPARGCASSGAADMARDAPAVAPSSRVTGGIKPAGASATPRRNGASATDAMNRSGTSAAEGTTGGASARGSSSRARARCRSTPGSS